MSIQAVLYTVFTQDEYIKWKSVITKGGNQCAVRNKL